MTATSQIRARFPCVLIILLTVSTCCWAEPSTGANPFDARFDQLVQRFASADAPSKAVLAGEMHELREYVTDAARVTSQLTSVAEDWKQPLLVRDEANLRRAQIAVSERRMEDARKLTDALGVVRDWTLITSGDCPQNASATARGLQPGPLGSVKVHTNGTLCVATAIFSPGPRRIALRYGASSPVSLYVNGTMLKSDDDAVQFAFDQYSVGAQLPAGWSTVWLELESEKPSGEFALRITGVDGGGIVLQADASRAAKSYFLSAASFPVTDLLQLAERNTTADGLTTFAALEQQHGLGYDYDHLESAAKLAPSAERWFAVAEACPAPTCAFSALNKALALDSNFTEAKLALAGYYVTRGQLEKSRDLLQQVIAHEPANFIAHKKLADVLTAVGATSAAIRESRKFDSRVLPIWLKRELAFHYEESGLTGKATAMLNQVWSVSFDDERTRTALERLAERRGDAAALDMLVSAAETLDPMLSQAPVAVAQNVPPDHADQTETLSEGRSEWLKNASFGTPARVSVMQATKDADAPYFIDAGSEAARVRKNAPRENSNVVTLADITVERMQENGQSTQRTQQVFYIANDRGARDYSTRNVQYSNATQKLTILRARVYKDDGRIFEAEDLGETAVADTNVSMYYDTRSRTLRFPTLERGDVIEIAYRTVPNSSVNPYGNYFGALVTFQNGLPQRLRRYILVAPNSRKLNIVEARMPAPATVKRNDKCTTYVWEARNMKPLVSEPRAPSLTEVAPYVNISTFANWNDLARWYVDIITPQFKLDGELRDALARITAGATTEQEKIHAIHEFVLRNTHYVAMEFGIYSYKPYAVSQVYARRFGDCKDKASLMIALMRAAGIDAELALVRTRKLGDVDGRATSLAVFNHAVVYIPKYDMWLDGTAEYAGSRELPLDDQGAMALAVNLKGTATLRRIPITLPMQNYTHRVVRAEVQRDGNIIFSGSAYTRGEDAPGLRREYEIADRQRDTVRANLSQVYSGIQVDSVHVEGAHDIERDIDVKFSGSLDKFLGQKQLSLSSSWLAHQYVNSLAPLNSRNLELQLPAPWTTEEEIHFTLPDGAEIENVPSGLRNDTPFGTAVIHYERRGHELVVTTSVQFRKLRISPSEYSQFRKFCSDVEKSFRREIKVRLG